MKHWQQGCLLTTRTTMKWSKQQRIEANKRESCMVFKNFSFIDEGRSRIFVKPCKTSEEASTVVIKHNKFADRVNKLIKILRKSVYEKRNYKFRREYKLPITRR